MTGVAVSGGDAYVGPMTLTDAEAYLVHIRAECARFRAVPADADPAARVA